MQAGFSFKLAIILILLPVFMIAGCGKSEFEQGKELYDQGKMEQALPLLKKASGKEKIPAQTMIAEIEKKQEEDAEKNCQERVENYLKMLSQCKTTTAWDKTIVELKAFKCRKVDPKPYIDKAYVQFISYLAKWDNYPQAIDKFCEFTGCETEEPHLLIREEDIMITNDEGKKIEETIQQEFLIAPHELSKKMFLWLIEKDPVNARWFDRYAKYLYTNERYKNAQDSYETIANLENIGYEVKSRAKVAADHLKKGGRAKRISGDNHRYFWVEDVKKKSKLKALKKDLISEQKKKAVEEMKTNKAAGK